MSPQDSVESAPLPRFRTALVGYQRRQVDAYVAQLFEAMSNLCRTLDQREAQLKARSRELAEARQECESLQRRAWLEHEALDVAAKHLAGAAAAVARLRRSSNQDEQLLTPGLPPGPGQGFDRFGAPQGSSVRSRSTEPARWVSNGSGRQLPFHLWAISQLLRQQRRSAKRSLDEAAEALGVSAFHLWRLEEGECLPSESLIQRAARYYGSGDAAVELVRVLRAGGEPTVSVTERATPQPTATLAAR